MIRQSIDAPLQHIWSLRERLATLQATRDNAQAALERARSGARSVFRISSHMIERFAERMREKLRSVEVSFRKAQLGAIVERIEVDDEEVRISAGKTCWRRR